MYCAGPGVKRAQGREEKRDLWDKAREKKINKKLRSTGHDTGEGEESLPIGNSSSSQAAEKKEMSMRAGTGILGGLIGGNSLKKRYMRYRTGVPRSKKACLPGGFKPNPSHKPPSPSALNILRLIW